MSNTLRSSAVPLLALLLSLFHAGNARANVYATNIRLNGGTTNVTIPSGGSVNIGYLLNEAATAGLAINIASGGTTVRTITLTNGAPGTARGTNTVAWNGKDNLGNPVGGGTYSVSITAAAIGSSDWWQTSDNSNTNNYVFEPRGIAVNKNTNSPYYGRIFVANSHEGFHPESNPGDAVGFQKINADGSTPDDGGFSDGGFAWPDNYYSPWKIAVGDDDRLYANDFSGNGLVFSFDQTISSNSLRQVLRADNWPSLNASLNGLFVTGSGTNLQVWMADDSGGFGIRRWNVTTSGVIATNDRGTTVVQAGPPSDLNTSPYDVAVDRSNRIYTIQRTVVPGDSANRLARFPAYAGSSETNADWKIGSGDNELLNAYGVAINSSGNYVAVTFEGYTNGVVQTPGSVRIFSTTNGTAIKTLGAEDMTDVDWDNAGNLYVANEAESLWQVYSPPGSNQATTVALASVVVTAPPVQPVLSAPSYSNGQYHFTLTGEANVTYIILGSTDLVNWVPVATSTSVFAVRQITITAPASQTYYRAMVGPYTPASPFLSAPFYAAGQFQFTLIGDPNLSYVIQASSNLLNWGPVLTNTNAIAMRPIAIPSPAPRSFYRALIVPSP